MSSIIAFVKYSTYTVCLSTVDLSWGKALASLSTSERVRRYYHHQWETTFYIIPYRHKHCPSQGPSPYTILGGCTKEDTRAKEFFSWIWIWVSFCGVYVCSRSVNWQDGFSDQLYLYFIVQYNLALISRQTIVMLHSWVLFWCIYMYAVHRLHEAFPFVGFGMQV